MSSASRDTATAIGLSFVAGFVDTLGFIALFGLFTAHVTGNFVLIGAALSTAAGQAGLIAKLLALPTFVLVAAGVTVLARRTQRSGGAISRRLISAQIILLALFATLGWSSLPITDPDAALPILAGLTGVGAMAVQNVAGRLAFSRIAPTTVMTGNVTQLVIDLVDGVGAVSETRSAALANLRRLGGPVLAFALGAAAGATGFALATFAALTVPILLLCLIWTVSGQPKDA